MSDTLATLSNSAKRFFSGTLLSRCSGLIREVLMAAAFGTVPAVAAFWMAFRFAHLLRRLLGEGGLHVAFIPHFETLRKENPQKAAQFFYALSSGMLLLLLGLTFVSEIVLGGFLWWGDLSLGNQDVIRLTMLMLPALLFICLYALNTSLLNCEQKYFLPSAAPVILNCVWIATVIVLWQKPAHAAMESLAMVLVFAFAAQWVVTFPSVYHYLMRTLGSTRCAYRSNWKEMAALLRPFFLALLGVAATQINNALDSIFARCADPEAPALLWYALRLQQVPLALFGIGLTGALLPPISRAVQNQEHDKYTSFLNFSLKKCLALMIPMTFAFFALGFSSVNLVYGRGEFDHQAIVQSTYCLWGYGAGLLPMNLVLILAAAFYALKNYKTPTLFCIVAVVCNIGLNALFVFALDMKAVSIAISTSVIAALNALCLGYALYKKQGLRWNSLLGSGFKVSLCSFFAALVAILAGYYCFGDNTFAFILQKPFISFPQGVFPQLMIFLSEAGIFAIVLYVMAKLTRTVELLDMIPSIRQKFA